MVRFQITAVDFFDFVHPRSWIRIAPSSTHITPILHTNPLLIMLTRGPCKVSRKYKPSTYEEKHKSIVERIHAMREKEERERYLEIRKVIYEEYEDSINW